jgi:hypothetical protein
MSSSGVSGFEAHRMDGVGWKAVCPLADQDALKSDIRFTAGSGRKRLGCFWSSGIEKLTLPSPGRGRTLSEKATA